MRVVVISDIHGNLHAFEAVLSALETQRPDAIWCLGDLVGYGPRPNRCCALSSERADLCLVGNHDLVVLGELPVEDFNDEAAAAARWTQGVLGEKARAYMQALEPSARVDDAGVELYHASPRDPVWEYVLDAFTIQAAFEQTSAPLVLVGHSHIPIRAGLVDDRLTGEHAPDGTEVDLSQGRFLLNPGSVGQPRDGDPRAAYLVLDFDEKSASFRRVEYPVERTQDEMRERELPDALAERLGHGV